MKTITMFSWGYYGWGNATKHLIKAVDAIEQRRGFEPPIFVDIRIRRAGRAPGFVGPAFEKLLGERHVWMPTLGNKRIITRAGKRCQIAKPEAAEALLDLAIKASKERRRLIFFCNCLWSKRDGKHNCHRSVVADLVIAAAKKRKVPVRVVEWPGDERTKEQMVVSPAQFKAVRRGVMFVPMPRNLQPKDLAGPSWGSIMTFTCGDEGIHRLVGPLIWRNQKWHVQILELLQNPSATLSEYRRLAKENVASHGFDAQVST